MSRWNKIYIYVQRNNGQGLEITNERTKRKLESFKELRSTGGQSTGFFVKRDNRSIVLFFYLWEVRTKRGAGRQISKQLE